MSCPQAQADGQPDDAGCDCPDACICQPDGMTVADLGAMIGSAGF